MARTKLTQTSNDLIGDGGNVLWSLVQGEQLELEVDLALLGGSPSQNFVYECDFIEALGDEANLAGAKGSLGVRYLYHKGEWSAPTTYIMGDCCTYMGKGYAKITKSSSSSTPPDTSTEWKESSVNLIFIQFLSSFSNNFQTQPTVGQPASAFFELKVSEQATSLEIVNSNNLIARSWKPVRGRVEILYSPTVVVV